MSVFLTENLSATSVNINIHLSQPGHTPQLYTFQATIRSSPYKHFAITPLPPIECLSAVPIISTRPIVLDTVLLSQAGTLYLITSGNRQIPFTLPVSKEEHREVAHNFASSLRMANDGRTSTSSRRNIIKLSDPIGPRFTATYEDGETIRINGDFRIKHKLTRQCMEALSYALPAQGFFFVKRELIHSSHGLSDVERTKGKVIWTIFSRVLRTMLNIEVESKPSSPLDSVLSDSLASGNPISRRLAKRVLRNRPQSSSPLIVSTSTPSLIFGENLRVEDAAPVLLALHLVAQDLRLSSTSIIELGGLVNLISDLATQTERLDWKDYWARLLPSATSTLRPTATVKYDTSILDQFDEPPDILTYLQRQLTTRTTTFPVPQTILTPSHTSELGRVEPCSQLVLVTSIYSYFSKQTPITIRAASAVQHLVDLGLGQDWILDLPYGISVPIMEMIRVCQYNPPKDWNSTMYELVGRWDLGVRASGAPYSSGREESASGLGLDRIPSIKELMASEEGDKEGNSPPSDLPHVRFGSDRRVQEVERIMQTTRIRTISIQDPKGASEADIARYHQSVVNTIAHRTLSIPVGQGMFEFGTRSTNITDIWNVPLIELSVKPGLNKPTLKAEIIGDSAEWPCFHNGVAAGLAISPECKGLDSSWIVFNRPNILNAEHGGFLLGLGLTGHLRNLTTYHAFPLLEPRHDFTSVGLILGLACSYAGSEDLLVTKVLSLHTHALLPMGSMELNASPIIQSSALVGLGLVYVGSRNLRMAEVTLNEVGRKEMINVDGFGEYQESYSFSAAMAFGLIMLGKGGTITSEVDRRMLNQLRKCISGDSSPSSGDNNSRKRANTDVYLGIDHNLTSPGATLALGLMYLKSSRKDIADMISIPQSMFELDQVRPDLLLLRTYARSLILWEDITPTLGWIEDQLPSFIRQANKNPKRTNTMELSTELAYLNIVSGACFAIGMKFAGTATELAHTNLMNFFGVLSKASSGSSMTYEGRIRRTAARQCLNIVTISLAMVMSGTGELGVLRRLRVSHGQEGSGVNYGSHMAMHMSLGMLFLGKGHYTLGNSNLAIATISIAFFPRFLSAPGDNKSYPQAFRHLWALASEPRCLIAKDVEDNQTVYLPVKLKVKEQSSKDVNGKKEIKIRQQNLISPTLITPFENIKSIEIDSPRYWSIFIDFDDSKNERSKKDLIKNRIIYVKRKMGFLDYNSDPKGNRSLFIKIGSMTGIDLHYDLISKAKPLNGLQNQNKELKELIKLHSGNPYLILLSELFDSGTSLKKEEFEEFIKIIILECLSLDKPNLINIYISMFLNFKKFIINNQESKEMEIENLNQIKMLKFFYEKIFEKSFTFSNNSTILEKKFSLIRPNFINSLIRQLSSSSSISNNDKEDYYEENLNIENYLLGELNVIKWNENLVKYIWNKNLPCLSLLNLLKEKVRQSSIDRNILELKIKDVSEAYRNRIISKFDEFQIGDKDENVNEGDGWKVDSIRDSIIIWTE
nr:uncharacterized protein I206_03559 [Kwoniella pini CBS 10737]OCF50240.1 hypothetical protein I206_03559 [Kwoniella pini CBS 10737]